MKAKLAIASGALLLMLGAALIFVGVLGFAGRYDIDADRTGMALVGGMYGLIGLLLAVGGWQLFKHGRRPAEDLR